MKMYYVYIIRCTDNSLYTGSTSDIKKRLSVHFDKNKKCAKYTKSHQMQGVEAVWQCSCKSDALKLEYRIKELKKHEKERLIKENFAPKAICEKLENLDFSRIYLQFNVDN